MGMALGLAILVLGGLGNGVGCGWFGLIGVNVVVNVVDGVV
jgi:hypothetical protein